MLFASLISCGGGGGSSAPAYTCTNGTPIPTTIELDENIEECASCHEGFGLSQGFCKTTYPVVCHGGVAIPNIFNIAKDFEICHSCKYEGVGTPPSVESGPNGSKIVKDIRKIILIFVPMVQQNLIQLTIKHLMSKIAQLAMQVLPLILQNAKENLNIFVPMAPKLQKLLL